MTQFYKYNFSAFTCIKYTLILGPHNRGKSEGFEQISQTLTSPWLRE